MLNQPFNVALRWQGRLFAGGAMSAWRVDYLRIRSTESGRWMDSVRAACVCKWCLHRAWRPVRGRPLSKVY